MKKLNDLVNKFNFKRCYDVRKNVLQIHAVDHCNNNCKDCNHYSLYSDRKEFQAEDYFKALDVIYERDWYPQYLVVIGGEPFLHSNLTDFIGKIKERYPKSSISTTTNGFWITEENIKKHAELFQYLSRFIVTIYPNLFKKINKQIPVNELNSTLATITF